MSSTHWVVRGLSPRVRGNPVSFLPPSGGWRSIPACAGEPDSLQQPPGELEVYPRVCGGTGDGRASGTCRRGLSPRVRGNPDDAVRLALAARSIPACAGEPSATTDCIPRSVAVYPRVCGGTRHVRERIWSRVGLSPRVRGNPFHGHGGGSSRGSIPACAGEPCCISARPRCAGVYPRVCGGTIPRAYVSSVGEGLSPRVRGNRHRLHRAGPRGGSIPACAGEPRGGAALARLKTVYPRVCGGTMLTPSRFVSGGGLSPRVRGNPPLHFFDRSAEGSIPACAGEP